MMSWKPTAPVRSRDSAVKAVIETGTLCRSSERLRAVTTTSSSEMLSAAASAANAAGARITVPHHVMHTNAPALTWRNCEEHLCRFSSSIVCAPRLIAFVSAQTLVISQGSCLWTRNSLL